MNWTERLHQVLSEKEGLQGHPGGGIPDSGAPIVLCTRVNRDGTTCFRFYCDFCARDHYHAPEEGYRRARCCDASPFMANGYILHLKRPFSRGK